MPKHGSIILYVHGNQKARYDGQPRTSTSTLTHLLNYDPECEQGNDVSCLPNTMMRPHGLGGCHSPQSSRFDYMASVGTGLQMYFYMYVGLILRKSQLYNLLQFWSPVPNMLFSI